MRHSSAGQRPVQTRKRSSATTRKEASRNSISYVDPYDNRMSLKRQNALNYDDVGGRQRASSSIDRLVKDSSFRYLSFADMDSHFRHGLDSELRRPPSATLEDIKIYLQAMKNTERYRLTSDDIQV